MMAARQRGLAGALSSRRTSRAAAAQKLDGPLFYKRF